MSIGPDDFESLQGTANPFLISKRLQAKKTLMKSMPQTLSNTKLMLGPCFVKNLTQFTRPWLSFSSCQRNLIKTFQIEAMICTDHKNGIDFFMRLVKWPKIDVKKCQNLILKVDFQRQKSFKSFFKKNS